jgi:hypothetical protein
MFQVPVTFQIYLVFENTWEDWGNYHYTEGADLLIGEINPKIVSSCSILLHSTRIEAVV